MALSFVLRCVVIDQPLSSDTFDVYLTLIMLCTCHCINDPINTPHAPLLKESTHPFLKTQERVFDSAASPVLVTLDNGNVHQVDVVVAAIGVEPNTDWVPAELERAPDGGILVDRCMQSSVPGIFAAGDCASVAFADTCQHWFQMRLWEQARTMGLYAAHCMAGRANELMCGFNFELVRGRCWFGWHDGGE